MHLATSRASGYLDGGIREALFPRGVTRENGAAPAQKREGRTGPADGREAAAAAAAAAADDVRGRASATTKQLGHRCLASV